MLRRLRADPDFATAVAATDGSLPLLARFEVLLEEVEEEMASFAVVDVLLLLLVVLLLSLTLLLLLLLLLLRFKLTLSLSLLLILEVLSSDETATG